MNSLLRRMIIGVVVLVVPLVFASGCTPSELNVSVEQPLQFNHAVHLRFFHEGKHLAEKTELHFGEDDEDLPEEFLEGACLECHDDWEETAECAGCHILFQDEELRSNKALRPCVGCHRTVWNGYEASIPTIEVCRSCHGAEPRTGSETEMAVRDYLEKELDIPWVRLNTLIDIVHFSHTAHVRFGGIACAECHQDVTNMTTPPNRVSVFSMERCIECHERRTASNDCLACHK